MTPADPDPLRVAGSIGAVLDALGIPYSIGGSLASSFSGEPRSTRDIDTSCADPGRRRSPCRGG